MTTARINLKDLSFKELDSVITSLGEPAFRGKQIRDWIYSKNCCSISDMTNLSKPFREKLGDSYTAAGFDSSKKSVSKDGTIKYLFGLNDGAGVETVYIPEESRRTVCVSTQVGCRFACGFCATGKQGFSRNLSLGEIINQIVEVRRDPEAGEPTNVVFMGMGEPLDNFGPVTSAIEIINAPDGFNIGGRKITLSTAGIPAQIRKLAETGLNMNLAISLHSADNEVRTSLMPINKKHPLEEVIRACADYPLKQGRKITFEIILFDGVNDSAKDAAKVIRALHPVRSKKVNLIRFNPVPQIAYKPSSKENVNAFKDALEKADIDTLIRVSRGDDIAAACGQLKSDYSRISRE